MISLLRVRERHRQQRLLASLLFLFAMPMTGSLSAVQAGMPALRTEETVAVVDAVAAAIQTHYFAVDTGEQLVNRLKQAQANGRFAGTATPAALAAQLTDVLREISQDKHFRVLLAPDEEATSAAAQEPVAAVDTGIAAARLDPDGIGYLALSHFPALSPQIRQAYAQAFSVLAPARALIIDVRGNHGGDPAAVADVLGYLFQRPAFVSMDFLARGQVVAENAIASDRAGFHFSEHVPIAVLVSARTFSGGEALAYDLQAYRRAVLLGQTTGGAANPSRLLALPAGLAVSVPHSQPRHRLTHTSWERQGVVPEIVCSPAKAEVRARALLQARLVAARAGDVSVTRE